MKCACGKIIATNTAAKGEVIINKKIGITVSKVSILLLVIAVLIVILTVNRLNDNTDVLTDKNISAVETTIEHSEFTWDEITENGVNEELLLKNIDPYILEKIADNLQELLDEEAKEEAENPEILLTEGWTRIFEKEKYKEVVAIGKPAMKPLYYILYKSENNGLYEYVCAIALQEISGVTFTDKESGLQEWETAKEYLNLFTQEISKNSTNSYHL